MKFRLGKMSVGDILDRGIKLLFSRLGTFYIINLIVQSPLIVFQIVAPILVQAELDRGDRGAILGIALGAIVLQLILQFIGMAAMLKIIEQSHVDRKVGIGEALGFALTRFFPLLLVSIIFGLVVGVGFILCIIPGFIFLSMYAFAGQAVVLERMGPIEGMNRSSQLTSGFKGRIFGIYLLTILLNFGTAFVLELALEKALPVAEIVRDADGDLEIRHNQTNHVIHVLIEAFVNILVTTYATICLTLAYFDLRTRKEGFDLELAAKGLAQREWDDDDDDYDDDDRPRGRHRDDDDDDRPRRPRDGFDDDDRPRRPRGKDDYEDDDRPRRHRNDDDDDDRDDCRRPRRN